MIGHFYSDHQKISCGWRLCATYNERGSRVTVMDLLDEANART